MSTNLRDYFNTRVNQELEQAALTGRSPKFEQVQAAAQEKARALQDGIALAKQRELAAANSFIGRNDLDPDSFLGGAANLGASAYQGISQNLVGKVTGFLGGDLEAMLRQASITEPELQAIGRFRQGKATPDDEALINAPRKGRGYSPLQMADLADAARARGERLYTSFDRSDQVYQGNKEALQADLGDEFSSNWDRVTKGASAAWNGEASGAKDVVAGLAKLIYNAGEAAVTNPQAAAEYVAENLPQVAVGVLGAAGRGVMSLSNVGYASEAYQKGITKYQTENNGAYPPEEERMKMATAAAGMALAEQVGDLSLLRGAKAAPDGEAALRTGFKQSLLNTGSATAKGVVTEGFTEGVQTALEGVATRTPASAQDIYEGVAIGAMVGGGIAGGGRAIAEATKSTPEQVTAELRKLADKRAQNAAVEAAIASADVTPLVDPKSPVYAPDRAVAALAGNSAQPAATEEVKAENFKKAEAIVAELEELSTLRQRLYENSTPEGQKSLEAQIAEATADNRPQVAEILTRQLEESRQLDGNERRARQVRAAQTQEMLVRARENLSRFQTEVATPAATTAPSAENVPQQSSVESLVQEIQQPVDTTQPEVAAERVKKADRVIRLAMASPGALTPEVAKTLADDTANGLTDGQREYLRAFSEARVKENTAKSLEGVSQEVFVGAPKFVGLQQYRNRITTALTAGNQERATQQLNQLKSFLTDHAEKAAAVAKAWSMGVGTQVVRVEGGPQRWKVLEGTQPGGGTKRMSDQAIRKNGGLTVNTERLVPAIQQEAAAIEAAVKEMEAAFGLTFGATEAPVKEEKRVADVPKASAPVPTPSSGSQTMEAAGALAEGTRGTVAQQPKQPESGAQGNQRAGRDTAASEPAAVGDVTQLSDQELKDAEVAQREDAVAEAEATTQSTEQDDAQLEEADQADVTDTSGSPEETSDDQDSNEPVEPDSPQLAVFSNPAPEGVLFDFKEVFRQVAVRENEATERPLAAVKDFLSSAFSVDGLRRFLGWDESREYTEEQLSVLQTFGDLADAWQSRIQSAIQRKSNPKFWHEDFAQYFIQETGETLDFEENVKTAISYGAFSYVVEAANRLDGNLKAQINGILGRQADHLVTDEEIEMLGGIGVRQNLVINTIGRRIVQALGLRTTESDKVTMDMESRLVQSLGSRAWKLLLDEGLIQTNEIDGLTMDAMRGVEHDPELVADLRARIAKGQTKDLPENLKGLMRIYYRKDQFVDMARDENGKLHPTVDRILKSNRGSKSILDQIFGADAVMVDPSLDPVPVTQTTLKNTNQGVPAKAKEILEHENQQPNRVREDMWAMKDLLGVDRILKIAGWKEVDPEKMQKSKRAAQQAKNEALERGWENFEDFVSSTLSNGAEGLRTAFYLPHELWKQHRIGISSNTVNPQSNKLVRFMITRPTWETKVDPNNPEQLLNFRLRVAEGFGIKTDKKKPGPALTELDQKLADEKVQKALELIEAGLVDKRELTNSEKDLIAEVASAGGEKMHSLDALMALVHFKRGMPIYLMGEVDGVTNGAMLSHAFLGAAESVEKLLTILNRGGFYRLGSVFKNYNIWRSEPGNLDLYEDVARAMTAKIQEIVRVGTKSQKGKQILSAETVSAAVAAIYSFTGELSKGDTVLKEARDLVKNPVTITMYGSSMRNVINVMAESFVGTVIDGLEASAVGGKRPQSREAVIKNLNTLLKIGRGPQVNPNMSLKDLLELELNTAQKEALRSAFRLTIGNATESSLTEKFGGFVGMQKGLNKIAQSSFEIYNRIYQDLRQKEVTRLVEAGEILHTVDADGNKIPLFDLSRPQAKALDAKLRKLYPVVHTYFSKVSGSLAGGLGVSKTDQTISGESFNGQAIRFKGVKGRQVLSVETRGMQVVPQSPGVSMLPMMIHSSDSAISHLAALLGEVLNIHDAHGTGSANFKEAAKNLNQAAFDVLMEYSPAREMYESLGRTISAAAELARNGEVSTEVLEAFRSINVRREDDADFSATGILEYAEGLAFHADQRKFELLSILEFLDQYALEGGEFAVPQEARDEARRRLEALKEGVPEKLLEDAKYLDSLIKQKEKAPQSETKEATKPVEPAAETFTPAREGQPAQLDAVLVEGFKKKPVMSVAEAIALLRRAIRAKGDTRANNYQLELLEQLSKSVSSKLVVKVITPDMKPGVDFIPPEDATQSGALGWFEMGGESDKQTIYLYSEDFVNSGLQSTETLLHELVHGALTAVINIELQKKADNDSYTSPAFELIQELDALRKAAQEFATKNEIPVSTPAVFQDVHEFVAYGMTQIGFQRNVLSKMQVENKNAGNPLVNAVNALKQFIRKAVGLLFSGSSKKQQERMETALAVLIQNVGGLLAQQQADRQVLGLDQSLPEIKLSMSVQQFTTLDIHNALPGENLTEAFTNQLTDLMEGIVTKLHGPFGAFKAQVKSAMYAAASPEAAWMKVVDGGQAPLTNSVRGTPIQASPKELHAMEQVEATVRAALESPDTTTRVAYRELAALFMEIRSAIKPSDFASQEEYDYIFKTDLGADGRSHHLARFAAFTLAHQGFNTLMQRATGAASRARRAKAGKTWGERAQIIFENILAYFAERATGTYQGQAADRKLARLVEQLVDIEAKKQLAIARAAASKTPLDRAEQFGGTVANGLRAVVLKAAESDLVKNSSNVFVQLAGSVTRLQARDQAEWFLRTLGEFRDRNFPGLHGLPTEILNQVKGPGKMLNLLQLMSTNQQRMRKHIIDQTTKGAQRAFGERTFTKQDKAIVSQVFMRTGLHHLVDVVSMADLQTLVESKAFRDQVIADTEAKLRQLSEVGLNRFIDQYIHQANALAWFRTTGEVRHPRLLMNAHNIARLYGTSNRAQVTPDQARQAEPLIEQLVALYSLDYQDQFDLDRAATIFKEELARADGNGVEFVLRLHKGMEQASRDRLFAGQEALMIHGYTPEIVNPGTVIAVATLQDGKELEHAGYTRMGQVELDPADPDKRARYMYQLKDGGLARFQTGVVSYSGKQTKGTKLHSGYLNINTDGGLQNATMNSDINAAKPAGLARGPRPDLRKDGKTYMAPVLNPAGEIVNWRYMMKDQTRNSVLERNNDFDTMLGVLAGSIYDKASTRENNAKAFETLRDMYQQEKYREADSYVLVGPTSEDPKLREIWALLPEESRNYAKSLFGTDGMYVRKDMLLPVFGYRSFSLADMFKKSPEDRSKAESAFVNMIEWIFSVHAKLNAGRKGIAITEKEARNTARKVAVWLARGEKGWQEIVHEVKDIIVVKSIKVLVDNILSNWWQLTLSGVPLSDILRHHLVALRAVREYEDKSEELAQLELLVATRQAPPDAQATMNMLRNDLARNPAKDLIEGGLMPTIVEDVAADEESDPYTYKSQLAQKVSGITDKINPTVKAVAEGIYMSHNTRLYQTLSRVTRMSDFVARYTLYQHLTTKKGPDGKVMSKEDAMSEASEAFVNYDSPLPKQLAYLDQMGIIPFTKYFIRIQRVLLKLLRQNPGKVLSAALINNFVDLGPIVLESSWIARFGNNPLQWGAFEYPGTVDDLGTIAAATAIVK